MQQMAWRSALCRLAFLPLQRFQRNGWSRAAKHLTRELRQFGFWLEWLLEQDSNLRPID